MFAMFLPHCQWQVAKPTTDLLASYLKHVNYENDEAPDDVRVIMDMFAPKIRLKIEEGSK